MAAGLDFLIQLKSNCNKLFAHIALYTALEMPISTSQSYEKHHGREEYRHISLYVAPPDMPKGWNGIQRVVKLRRWGMRNHKPYDHTHYYILSKPFSHAQVVAKGIRNHWGIENNLHWVKDVVMGEDNMPIHNPHDASVVAVFNTVALNILRIAGYKPSKDTFALFANKVKKLYNLLHFETLFEN